MTQINNSTSTNNINLAGEINEGVHRLIQRVYYADTDFSGVVYHARYLEFMERGRTDFLRLSGIHHAALHAGETGEMMAWIVRRMEIDFRKPARIDDVLTVETRVEKISGARIYMAQLVLKDDIKLVGARVEAALINAQGQPRRFPAEWASILGITL